MTSRGSHFTIWLERDKPSLAGLRGAALVLVVLAALFSLHASGVGWLLQVRLVAMLSLSTLAGAALIARLLPKFPDATLFWLTAYLLGICLLSLLGFVFVQNWLFNNVPLASAPGRLWIGGGAIALLALVGLAQLVLAARGDRPSFELGPFVIMMSAAIIFNAVVHRGFYDYLPPNIGQIADHGEHVITYTDQLLQAGMPQPVFVHTGLQTLLVQMEVFIGSLSSWDRASGYKILSLAAFFVAAYGGYGLGRYGWGLGRPLALLAGVSTLAFCAIAPTPWNLSASGYLGFYSPAATFYHNATQLFGHGLAVIGLVLIALAWKSRVPLFAVGGLLLGFSLYFKPTFLYALAPALLVMFLLQRRRLSRDDMLGYAAVAGAFVLWFLYPAVVHTNVLTSSGFQLQLFDWSLRYIPANYPLPAVLQPVFAVAIAIVFSFAFPVTVLAVQLAEHRPQWRPGIEALRQHWSDYRFEILLVLFFVVGLGAATLLLERSLPQDGNQVWGLASGYLVLLPLFILLASRIRTNWARWLVWAIFALHILSSALHIYRWLALGRL
jgi:hypothetical protein